ncbi:MAG: hypothetical protein JXR97_05805, partial [Planctomycetes bacterium]|nr:hypothetical protein [Planctomycetota bacterium]
MKKIILHALFLLPLGLCAGCLDFGKKDAAAPGKEKAVAQAKTRDQAEVAKGDGHGAVNNTEATTPAFPGADGAPTGSAGGVQSGARIDVHSVRIEMDPGAAKMGGPLNRRREALIALIKNPDPTRFAELSRILTNENDVHSYLAASAIAAIGGIDAERMLRQGLTDKRGQVRSTCLKGLTDLRAPKTAEEA